MSGATRCQCDTALLAKRSWHTKHIQRVKMHLGQSHPCAPGRNRERRDVARAAARLAAARGGEVLQTSDEQDVCG